MPTSRKTASAQAKTAEPEDITSGSGIADIAEIARAMQSDITSISGKTAKFQFTASDALLVEQAKRDSLHEFALPHTMQGAYAMVRIVDPSSPEEVIHWPHHLIDFVINEVIRDAEGGAQLKSEDQIRETLSGGGDATKIVDMMQTMVELHRQICIRGFVEPALINSEEDRTSPDQVVIDVIDIRDRDRFIDWNDASQSEARAKAKTFPDK